MSRLVPLLNAFDFDKDWPKFQFYMEHRAPKVSVPEKTKKLAALIFSQAPGQNPFIEQPKDTQLLCLHEERIFNKLHPQENVYDYDRLKDAISGLITWLRLYYQQEDMLAYTQASTTVRPNYMMAALIERNLPSQTLLQYFDTYGEIQQGYFTISHVHEATYPYPQWLLDQYEFKLIEFEFNQNLPSQLTSNAKVPSIIDTQELDQYYFFHKLRAYVATLNKIRVFPRNFTPTEVLKLLHKLQLFREVVKPQNAYFLPPIRAYWEALNLYILPQEIIAIMKAGDMPHDASDFKDMSDPDQASTLDDLLFNPLHTSEASTPLYLWLELCSLLLNYYQNCYQNNKQDHETLQNIHRFLEEILIKTERGLASEAHPAFNIRILKNYLTVSNRLGKLAESEQYIRSAIKHLPGTYKNAFTHLLHGLIALTQRDWPRTKKALLVIEGREDSFMTNYREIIMAQANYLEYLSSPIPEHENRVLQQLDANLKRLRRIRRNPHTSLPAEVYLAFFKLQKSLFTRRIKPDYKQHRADFQRTKDKILGATSPIYEQEWLIAQVDALIAECAP